MERTGKIILNIVEAGILFLLANFPMLAKLGVSGWWLLLLVPLFVVINIIPNAFHFRLMTGKLRNSADGCELLILFLITTGASIVYSLLGWCGKLPLGNLVEEPWLWILNTVVIFLLELVCSGMVSYEFILRRSSLESACA